MVSHLHGEVPFKRGVHQATYPLKPEVLSHRIGYNVAFSMPVPSHLTALKIGISLKSGSVKSYLPLYTLLHKRVSVVHFLRDAAVDGHGHGGAVSEAP